MATRMLPARCPLLTAPGESNTQTACDATLRGVPNATERLSPLSWIEIVDSERSFGYEIGAATTVLQGLPTVLYWSGAGPIGGSTK